MLTEDCTTTSAKMSLLVILPPSKQYVAAHHGIEDLMHGSFNVAHSLASKLIEDISFVFPYIGESPRVERLESSAQYTCDNLTYKASAGTAPSADVAHDALFTSSAALCSCLVSSTGTMVAFSQSAVPMLLCFHLSLSLLKYSAVCFHNLQSS